METATIARRPRSPRVAFLLSVAAPGLGHVYAGRFGQGMALLVLGMALGPLGLFGFLPFSSWFRTVALVAFCAYSILWIASAVGAIRLARRAGEDYVLRDYNRWYVYFLLAAMALPVLIGWGSYVRAGIVQAFRVPTSSMFPTIHPGDLVLANRLAYREGPVRAGDIVIFPYPDRRHQYTIKRAVALPGERVAIRDGCLRVNGRAVECIEVGGSPREDHPKMAGRIWEERREGVRYRILLAPSGCGEGQRDFPEIEVPHGHCFVLGDNRDRSLDSRSYGPVPLADLVGRVDGVLWPRR